MGVLKKLISGGDDLEDIWAKYLKEAKKNQVPSQCGECNPRSDCSYLLFPSAPLSMACPYRKKFIPR